MWLLALEAFGAFFIFIFIIWWTMFSGRPKNKSDSKTTEERDQ